MDISACFLFWKNQIVSIENYIYVYKRKLIRCYLHRQDQDHRFPIYTGRHDTHVCRADCILYLLHIPRTRSRSGSYCPVLPADYCLLLPAETSIISLYWVSGPLVHYIPVHRPIIGMNYTLKVFYVDLQDMQSLISPLTIFSLNKESN